ncbi:MAG: sensor domain-containing diguanylate cyclase [Nitrospiria bacterium]
MKSNVDIDKLKMENTLLKQELRQRTRELSFFINSSKALTSTLEFKKVLKIIMEKAQKLIKCEDWSLLLLDEATEELYFEMAKEKKAKEVMNRRIKLGEGIAGWVAKKGTPQIVADASKDPRFNKSIERRNYTHARSILCVPIINKRRTIGVLEMVDKVNGEPFEEKDLDLLIKLVDQAAIAIERSHLYQKMADLAITDDLTKLFNFRHLDQTLDFEIRRCQRYGSAVSLIFLDMDYFKLVNDRHGHLMGSKVLIEVAQILTNNLRDIDIIARYGGDEFVVVLPETSVDTTYRISQRIQQSIRDHDFLSEEGLKIKLSASFGIAGYPVHAKNKKDLILLADQAMYQAKYGGRDRICIAKVE